MESNFYQILGLSQDAEDIVIRAAYRALMQRYHPDKSTSEVNTVRMHAIQRAYATLSDPVRRAVYDAHLDRGTPDELTVFYRSPHSIANLELRAWEILLTLHPEFGSSMQYLNHTDQHLAKTYRSFLLELISEKLASRLVQSVCHETHALTPIETLANPTQNHTRLH